MPHRVDVWLTTAARTATASALLAVVGCASDDGELVVVNEGSGRVAVASPVDPRQLRGVVAAPSRASGPLGDSIARYYAVARRADSLDAVFQAQRDALNRDARNMVGADRRTGAYARAFDEYTARAAVATRTRAARDDARRRAAALRTRLRQRFPEVGRGAAGSRPLRAALDSAARANGEQVERASLRTGHATLRLAPGVWWISVENAAGELTGTRRFEVRAGTRDTVHIES